MSGYGAVTVRQPRSQNISWSWNRLFRCSSPDRTFGSVGYWKRRRVLTALSFRRRLGIYKPVIHGVILVLIHQADNRSKVYSNMSFLWYHTFFNEQKLARSPENRIGIPHTAFALYVHTSTASSPRGLFFMREKHILVTPHVIIPHTTHNTRSRPFPSA